MNRKRGLFKGIVAVLMTAVLVLGQAGYSVSAEEGTDLLVEEGSSQLREKGESGDVSTDSFISPDSLSDNILKNESVDTSPDSPEEDLTDTEHPELTKAQMDTVDALKDEASELKDYEADEDYVRNEAVFFADSEEEAERVAKMYGGRLKVFAEGVATIVFEDENVLDVMNDKSCIDFDDPSEVPDVPIYANYIFHIAVNPDDDPLYSTSSLDPKGQWFHKAIESKAAWDKGYDGRNVKVAVIDTGIDSSNADLSPNIVSVQYAASFTSGKDENGHGTHCAGIIAGADNTLGGLGVAPNAGIISIRAGDADGNMKVDDVVQSIRKAISSGADIISMSFGGPGGSSSVSGPINEALKKGIVCVAAAGNAGKSTKNYPAACKGVVSVGATDVNGNLAHYSNYGSWVDLAAPGTAILSTIPIDKNVTKRVTGVFTDIHDSTASYAKMDGTSMATPVVAGVAALVLSAHPSYDAEQVTNALLYSDPDKSYVYGANTVNRGLNAYVAVNSDGKNAKPVVDGRDYLIAEPGLDPGMVIMQGKSASLMVETSIDTKKHKLTYERESGSEYITVDNKSGKIKVDKNAPVGDTAIIAVKCETITAKARVTVSEAVKAGKIKITNPTGVLSTVDGVGSNSARLEVSGLIPGSIYRVVIDKSSVLDMTEGGTELKGAYLIAPGSGSAVILVQAKSVGTAAVTVYATDGTGGKASIKVNCVEPAVKVNITYMGVPINTKNYPIHMAYGASLPLKAEAVGPSGTKAKGKYKYTWSGPYVNKSGKVTTPKNGPADFYVSVKAEGEGVEFTNSVHITSVLPEKIKGLGYCEKYMGRYYYYDGEGTYTWYLNQTVKFEGSRLDNIDDSNVIGPVGFKSKTSKTKVEAYTDFLEEYKNNQGMYVMSVKGPKIEDVTYSDFGVESFVPAKKGNYKILFTSLDGSGKSYTISFKVK